MYASLATEGIWHARAASPIEVSLPVDAQVRLLFDTVRLVDCNDAMLRMYGVAQPSGLAGVAVRDLLIDSDDRNVEMLAAFVRGGYRLDGFESVERTPDGARRVFLNSMVGVVRDGWLVEAWGSQRDITDRKQRESRARQVQAMDAVSLLSGRVAHDFNNLLTTILSSVELLAEQSPRNERAIGDADAIRRAARRGAELTRQLLALSQQQVLSPRPVDVQGLVQRIAATIRSAFAQAVVVDFLYDEAPVTASVDPDELERTLLHLAAYAAEAVGDRGSFGLDVRHEQLDDARLAFPDPVAPGAYVSIGLRHSGTPRRPADPDELFEPFVGMALPSLGTGLALATMYGFVRQSGGAVVVEPAPAGVALRIYFPTSTTTAPVTLPPRPPAPPGTRTLLVVEDDSAVRLLMKRVFERAGYTVLLASHGEEALGVARAHGPGIDALVTDVIMPGIGGDELARRLRLERPEMRVLIVSGYTANALRHQDLIGAADAFLQKPFTPQALVEKVQNAMR